MQEVAAYESTPPTTAYDGNVSLWLTLYLTSA